MFQFIIAINLVVLLFLLILLIRNALVFNWRTKACDSWFNTSQLCQKYLREHYLIDKTNYNSNQFDTFYKVLECTKKFHGRYDSLQSYSKMVFQLHRWSYKSITGSYEDDITKIAIDIFIMIDNHNMAIGLTSEKVN